MTPMLTPNLILSHLRRHRHRCHRPQLGHRHQRQCLWLRLRSRHPSATTTTRRWSTCGSLFPNHAGSSDQSMVGSSSIRRRAAELSRAFPSCSTAIVHRFHGVLKDFAMIPPSRSCINDLAQHIANKHYWLHQHYLYMQSSMGLCSIQSMDGPTSSTMSTSRNMLSP